MNAQTQTGIAAGTKILTTTGYKAIEDVRAGDRVELGQVTGRVNRVQQVAPVSAVTVSFSGGSITCTPDQEFITDSGIVLADTLTRGDLAFTLESASIMTYDEDVTLREDALHNDIEDLIDHDSILDTARRVTAVIEIETDLKFYQLDVQVHQAYIANGVLTTAGS